MTSSKKRKEFLIAKLRREEIERQNEAEVRIAQQKHEVELQALKEENRRRLTEAKLVELELSECCSENDLQSEVRNTSQVARSEGSARVKDWVDSVPSVANLAETSGCQIFPSQAAEATLELLQGTSLGNLHTGTQLYSAGVETQTTTESTPNAQEPQIVEKSGPYTATNLPASSVISLSPIDLPPPVSTMEQASYPLASTEATSVPHMFASQSDFAVETPNVFPLASSATNFVGLNTVPNSPCFPLSQPPFMMPTCSLPQNMAPRRPLAPQKYPVNSPYPPNCQPPRISFLPNLGYYPTNLTSSMPTFFGSSACDSFPYRPHQAIGISSIQSPNPFSA